MLYVTLGFRQFSHHFTDIRDALDAGDEPRARELLAQWQQVDASELPRSEIVRHVIEYSVLAAHRHVFGVLAWFSVLAAFGLGPAGAVLYRMSEFVSRYWTHTAAACRRSRPARRCSRRRRAPGPPSTGCRRASRRWRSRWSAASRKRSTAGATTRSAFPNDNDGVILAATSGAVNVRLGGEALKSAFAPDGSQGFRSSGVEAHGPTPKARPGREAEVGHLRSIVGLVWRSVVLWMVLLALLTLARCSG